MQGMPAPMKSSTGSANQVALEASIRLEEAKLSVVELIRLQHKGDDVDKELITKGKIALARAWRLLQILDTSQEISPATAGV